MNEIDYEKKIGDLSAKVNWLILGYRFGITGLLLLSSLLNLAVTLTIPKFEQIYMDALGPDHPMPPLTSWVLGCASFLPFLVCLWPLLGIISIWAFQKLYLVVIVPILLLTLIVAQFVVTWSALFLPMTAIMTGMGDAPPTH